MEFKTEMIAVVKLTELELARLLANHQLPEQLQGEARDFLDRIQQERARADVVDGVAIVPALTAGNGKHRAAPDLPATRRAMRKFRLATRHGKKKMHRTRRAKGEEECRYCKKPFKAHGWLVSHEARCDQNPDRVQLAA